MTKGDHMKNMIEMKRVLSMLIIVVLLTSAVRAAVPHAGSFSLQPGQVDWRATPLRARTMCEDMASEKFGTIRISAKVVVRAGDIPEHCQIAGFLPTEIGFEVNLPLAWNGRLYMYGNGGYAGEDSAAPYIQPKRDNALANGFATAWTDTGHRASLQPAGTFAQSPVALTNHAYLAVHVTVEFAKQLAAAFYGHAPNFSYWDGCSTGGRQGVMEAYRFPKDFNGILAGAPTLDWTSIMIKGLWRQSATQGTGLTVEKLQTVFKTVMSQCDAIDGLKDGLIDDPRQCAFDPHRDVPRCAAGEDGDACLTARQADALQKIYDGPPKGSGMPDWVREYPGFEESSIIGDGNAGAHWVLTRDGSPNTLALMADSWMKYLSFKNPAYDASKFDFIRDPSRARAADEEMNPKPDLRAFNDTGGKMIMWWGWSDMALNAGMGIDFYDRVVANVGLANTQKFYRFYLIPGVAHCAGGYGPCDVDGMPALIDWVEKGVAPERLAARRVVGGKTVYNRAYCAYPAATRYQSGDPEVPANYQCVPRKTDEGVSKP
jgi:feruloyl esterase